MEKIAECPRASVEIEVPLSLVMVDCSYESTGPPEQNVLHHISGYIASRVQCLDVTCQKCLHTVISITPLDEDYAMLVTLKKERKLV